MEQEKLNFNLLTTIKDVAKQIRHSELKEESIVDIKPKLDLIANYLLNFRKYNNLLIYIKIAAQNFGKVAEFQ